MDTQESGFFFLSWDFESLHLFLRGGSRVEIVGKVLGVFFGCISLALDLNGSLGKRGRFELLPTLCVMPQTSAVAALISSGHLGA